MDHTDDLRFRPLRADDREVLISATLDNVNWCGERFTRDQILETPELNCYAEFVPGRGDFGIVGIVGERVVAVAWAQYLPEPGGYGFVDTRTPECSVWVAAGFRGRGIGREVTARLLRVASDSGIDRLSLSVEAGNTNAVGLYRSLGFGPLAGREVDGVMVWESAQRTSRATRRGDR